MDADAGDGVVTGAIAVLGAAGFIGNRTIEMLALDDEAVVGVARRPSSLALPARFGIPLRVADARDRVSLTSAFAGCRAVVVAVAGDPATITGVIEPVMRAAGAAGVRRVVYLSTASVHGQSPPPGTHEATPLSDTQALAYNNAKVRAERELERCRAIGRTEVVVLRPGIVHGPRSQWTGSIADGLLAGDAYLVDGGEGICNSIYVDNLVGAIRLAIDVDGVDGEAFLVGDRETVRWRDLYAPIARSLGVDLDTVATPPADSARGERLSMAQRVRSNPWVRRLPAPLRAGLRAAYDTARVGRSRHDRDGDGGRAAQATISVEMALLHTCRTQLPWDKARAVLGYEPSVSFDDANARSVSWLTFAGYPTQGAP